MFAFARSERRECDRLVGRLTGLTGLTGLGRSHACQNYQP